MNILITGSNGFIAKNLIVHINELKNSDIVIIPFSRQNNVSELEKAIDDADFIFHLAGVNRPKDVSEFKRENTNFTRILCDIIISKNKKIPIVYSSSIQAELDNFYGMSKRESETILKEYEKKAGAKVYIFRLHNVFGKWCKPNYNSVVATFCYNVIHDLPVKIDDPSAFVKLVYIDDVIETFIKVLLQDVFSSEKNCIVNPVYEITVGDLINQINLFKKSRESLVTERVGTGLVRALYSTYISYYSASEFSYGLEKHVDSRGIFVEILKTHDSGQISYFTAQPNVTRGGHYHHTKTEKFLVVKGEAKFCFRNILTNEKFDCITTDKLPELVETIPGWSHDITNIGNDELIVVLWANEIHDHQNPDTVISKV